MNEDEDAHHLLQRAGYLRQAHTGLFHLLPLGLRVQDKIERLIDKHMRSLGASKVSLSSLSSQDLWRRSGRLEGRGSELFHLEDRKGAQFLLAPTHEEEITTIIANAVHSYRDLPLRLYQISRKYRDEARPRQGLLRGREFLMKDLYTFDATDEAARQTYEQVRRAYVAFLDELRLPYIVASADSGNMGGTLSHEFHFAAASGEDTVIQCTHCDHSVNEELFVGKSHGMPAKAQPSTTWSTLTTDHSAIVQVYHPASHQLNTVAVKSLVPDIDLTITNLQATLAAENLDESALPKICLYDPRLLATPSDNSPHEPRSTTISNPDILLTKAQPDEICPNCSKGRLSLSSAIEIGHTFHLGTRYSAPLAARILDANNRRVEISMGCHGIGVSRLIGAIAGLSRDEKGLNWPWKIAPWQVVIVSTPAISERDVSRVYDRITDPSRDRDDTTMEQAKSDGDFEVDAIIDDRTRSLGWKLRDADLIGYPFIIILGKDWGQSQTVELQCRRLNLREKVGIEALPERLALYSARL